MSTRYLALGFPLIAGLVVGCGGPTGMSEQTAPLTIRPADLATAQDGTEIRALIQGWAPGTDVVARVNRAFSTGMTLVSWPDQVVVGTRSSVVADDSIWGSAYVLTPSTNLAPGWYAVRVDLGGTTEILRPVDDAALDITHDGQIVTVIHRFHVGSLPLLSAFSEYNREADEVLVTLSVSESVALQPGLELDRVVQVTAEGTEGCAYRSGGSLVAELAAGRIGFVCAGGADMAQTTLSWTLGLVSGTGVPMRDTQGRGEGSLTWSGGWAPQTLSDAFVASSGSSEAP
jgi:hypothetical protein